MKRFVTMVLAVVLLIGCLPAGVEATQTSALGMAPIGADGYKTMTTSQMMLDVLKVTEGFSATPYWDYAQWTIGFGSYAGSRDYDTKPDLTVTPAEAEEMLKTQLANSYEKYVNNYCMKIGKQPSQNQFDALVSFTYNLGSSWMSGSMVNTWLRNPTTEMDMVNAMGRWVRAGDRMLYGLVQRRIREAIIFLKGEYYLPSKPDASHCVKTNLKVISNDDLPYYASVVYQYGFVHNGHAVGNGHEIGYFAIGETYDSLHIPTREGYRFAGWQLTKRDGNRITGGGLVDASTVVKDNLELTAVWTEDPLAPTDPTDPSDPSEPTEPSQPTVPSEPEPVKDPFPFEDVPEDEWYRVSVEFVYDNDLMNGMTQTHFYPNSSMSRGMLVTVIYRIAGTPELTEEQKGAFEDTAGKYYTDAVDWAKANGIVNGITDTLFCPDRNVTRQEAVAIFHRYCIQYLKLEATEDASLDRFADAQQVSAYAQEAMAWAVGAELVAGSKDGGELYLSPKVDLNRCQSATMLMRLVTQIIP